MGCGRSSNVNDTSPKSLYSPFVIVGPSGVGKGTLIKKIFEKYPGLFSLSVSYTTRKPREGEIHGQHYNFVEQEEFEQLVKEDGFIEWCNVHGKMYGTAIKELERIKRANQIPIFEIDVQGAEKVRKGKHGQANFLFILPCADIKKSEEVLYDRLKGRGTETEEQIRTRVGNSKAEIDKFAASKFFQYSVVNEDLEKACADLFKIIENEYKVEFETWNKQAIKA